MFGFISCSTFGKTFDSLYEFVSINASHWLMLSILLCKWQLKRYVARFINSFTNLDSCHERTEGLDCFWKCAKSFFCLVFLFAFRILTICCTRVIFQPKSEKRKYSPCEWKDLHFHSFLSHFCCSPSLVQAPGAWLFGGGGPPNFSLSRVYSIHTRLPTFYSLNRLVVLSYGILFSRNEATATC